MSTAATTETALADQRLEGFLVRRGFVSREQVEGLARWARAERLTLVEAIDRKGLIREEDLAGAIAKELRLPYVNLPTLSIDTATVPLIKEGLAAGHLVIPIRSEGSVLILAMANPFDLEVLRKIEFSTGRQVRAAVATGSQIKDAIEHFFRFDSNLSTMIADVPDVGPMSILRTEEEENENEEVLRSSAEQAPIVKMVNLVLSEAVKNRASDVHIEPGPNATAVRFRINGILEDALQVPKWVQAPVVARIKVMSKLDITEHRVPQDGALRVRFHERVVDLRVSSLPTSYGEKIVMRVLDPTVSVRTLADVGLAPEQIAAVRRAISKPEGMILVTGPTGSGKTTTLYAVIQEILSPDVNIVTIENPIEYDIKGVSQVQVNEKQGLTFAGALRSILRQDPDVILLGEIRDRETAEVAFQAAQTGHLVLSTLHTNDTVSSIYRLIDLGIEPYLPASAVHLVMAQRLIRTICPRCAEETEIDDHTRASLGLSAAGAYRRGKGCPACRKSGYAARTGIYELLEIDDHIGGLIESRASELTLRQAARKAGMKLLREDAVGKIEKGLTTPEETIRVVQVERVGPSCPECGAEIEQNFSVCPFCLHQLQRTCSDCEAALKPEWRKCPFCGAAAKGEEKERPAPSVESAPGAEEPVSEAPAGSPSAAESDAIPAPGSIDVPEVLVVDDNEDLRKVIKLSLERGSHPMRVEGASNGFEALGMIEVKKPHLIILDIMMPGMDGFEVCRRLRANIQTAFIPIIMLTAREDADAKLEGFRVGTDDYLVKPFNRAELMARATRLLERTYGYRRPASDDASTGTE